MSIRILVEPMGNAPVSAWVQDSRGLLTHKKNIFPGTGAAELTIRAGEILVFSDAKTMLSGGALTFYVTEGRGREIEPGVFEETLVPDTAIPVAQDPVESAPVESAEIPVAQDPVGTDANGSPVSDEADPLLEPAEGSPQ